MKKDLILKFVFPALLLSIILGACNINNADKSSDYQPVFSADTSGNKTLIWGFPSFSYCENSELIVKYLNKRLSGAHIIVKACVSYEEYLDNLHNDKFDLTVINGIVAVQKESKNYSIIGKIKDDSEYCGAILIRKDAGIKKVIDLKGKTIALVTNRTIPGTMMSLYYLYQNGLDVNQDFLQVDVASFESTIITTYIGKSDAGLCLKRNWNVYVKNHPEVLEKVELKWETPPLLNNALLVKKTIDKDINSQLTRLFFSLNTNNEGKIALNELGISGFEKADSSTFKPIMEFKKKFDSVIH